MPYHAGAHKAKPARPKFRYQTKHRVLIAAIGALFILIGLSQVLYGRFIGLNRWRLPVYATDAIGAGVLVALCALIPSSWLERAVKAPKSNSRATGL
jgi:hypothetical protein